MDGYETLVFPNTDIFRKEFYPLLLFFSPLHFLQLMEPDQRTSEGYQDSELFLEKGLCTAHLPAPLGENHFQFLRLVDDIKKRREHYFTQIKTLSTTLKPTSAETRKNQIVSLLLQDFGIKHQNTEQDLSLWRARLVLAMAEILDSDQESVREEFSEQLDYFSQEIAAFRSLPEAKGTDEAEFLHNLEDIMAQLEKPRVKDSLNRMEAWLRLLKNQPLPAVKVWLAASRDSGEYFFTKYESISRASAVPIQKLAFPAYIDASAKYVIEYIENFQKHTAVIQSGLVADFEKIVKLPYLRDSNESLLPYGTDWAGQWEEKLDEYFPASGTGRNHVTFYLFPDQSIHRLLSMPKAPGGSPDQAHGLLAVLGSSS